MSRQFNFLIFIFLYVQCCTSSTSRPIIGILAQESEDNKSTFIPGSYVTMTEASGARVVPIFTNQNQSYYDNLLSSINGVVFTGGSVDLTKNGGMVKAGNLIYEYGKKVAKQGKIFPILGVCQGMELLLYLSNDKHFPMSACRGFDNIGLPLVFLENYKTTSLFENAHKEDIITLIMRNSTVNHHGWCLTKDDLKKNNLDKQWRPLTTTKYNGTEFISSMESLEYPFAAVQFHPEKTAFEWRPDENNEHDMKSVIANRIFYDWLSYKARKSLNKFKTKQDELNSLILNYQPKFSGLEGNYNDELYIFP